MVTSEDFPTRFGPVSSRLTASASVANLFVVYLGEFWLGFGGPAANILVLTLLLGVLGFVNYRGVGLGSNVSSVFAADGGSVAPE